MGSLTTPLWTVPAGKLAYGRTFYWTAQVRDGNAASLWSAPDYFTIPAARQPLVTAHLGAAPYDATVKGVDPQLGDYSTQTTDATIPGPSDGPTLSVQRTYNSLDPGVFKAFGAGWSSLLDMRATEDADGSGNVVITLADGRQKRFGANGDGTYSPPAGDYAVLSAPASGYGTSGFMLTEKSGTRYFFQDQNTDPVTGQTYWGLTQYGNRNGHGPDVQWLSVTLTLPDGSIVKPEEPTRTTATTTVTSPRATWASRSSSPGASSRSPPRTAPSRTSRTLTRSPPSLACSPPPATRGRTASLPTWPRPLPPPPGAAMERPTAFLL
ncbi:DUF6531 domain-containing protein [Streptomyces shenzhenensis]|uniref:DUF6531 domain-containing protein n=1 Tax=Streptomyces shenzhenensis TaxID=943815 RepID=UPI001F3A6A5D|nr:DUF6531 domain-containing protein [Streptomyces shenzhenensis]